MKRHEVTWRVMFLTVVEAENKQEAKEKIIMGELAHSKVEIIMLPSQLDTSPSTGIWAKEIK